MFLADNDLKPLYFTLAVITASLIVKRIHNSENIYDFFNLKKQCNLLPQSQDELIDLLHYHKRMVFNKDIIQVLKNVDRKLFLDDEETNPYYDEPKSIGYNATISAPHMHACMLDYLAEYIPKCGNGVALDVGSGSGYVTACLAKLLGITGKVVGLEHIPELVERSKISIGKLDSSLLNRITFLVGDGLEGWKENKYDVIYLGAAIESLNAAKELIDQLKNGGRMVMPVGASNNFHELMVLDKDVNGKISVKSCGVVRFVPLTTKENQLNPKNKANLTKITEINGEKTLIRCEVIPAPDSIDSIKEFEKLMNNNNSHQ